MSRVLILSFLFIIPLHLFPQSNKETNPNGFNTFYYENGSVSSEGNLKNGKPEGYWKTYYPNGTLKSEGNRKNFQLDSTWKFYNEKGILVSELNYREGKKEGATNTYDTENGSLLLSENYSNDLKEGNTTEYYPSENNSPERIKKIIPFVKGLEDGKGFEYSPDSTIITITQYKMGYIEKEESLNRTDRLGKKQGVWKTFYGNGMINTETNFYNDKKNGYERTYTSQGLLIKSTKYVNGEVYIAPEIATPELKIERYENGNLKSKGAFFNDKEEGLHLNYSPEGEPDTAKIYTNGKLIEQGMIDTSNNKQGIWMEYYLDGNLKSKGTYLNDKKTGEWTYYYPNGTIEQMGKYDKKSKIQGIWTWYYPCDDNCESNRGTIKKTEHYLDNMLEGEMIEYSDSGKVIAKGNYANNEKEGLWTIEYFEYKEEGFYEEGIKKGPWKTYYLKTGKVRFNGEFLDNFPVGKHAYYYDNGVTMQQGNYAGGLKDGLWHYYDKNGEQIIAIEYSNGIEKKYDGSKAPTY